MTPSLALLLTLALGALVFANPFVGLCLTLASVPVVQSLPTVPLASSVTSLLGGMTLVSCLIGVLLNRWQLSLLGGRTYGWLLAFGATALAGLALSPVNLMQGLYTYAQMVILAWLTVQLVTTRRRIETLMIVWILILVVTQTLALADFNFGILGRENRLEGLTKNANELAFYSVVGICFTLYFLLTVRRTLGRVLLTAALGLATLSVLLSASRGGFVVLLTVVVFALLSLRFEFVRGLRFSGFLLLAGVALLLLTSRLNLSFVPTLASQVPRAAAQIVSGQQGADPRAFIVRNGLRAWAGHPVFGVGLGVGSEAGAYSGYAAGRTASHSTYLTALVETGIVGFVLFCGLLLTTWFNLSQGPPEGQLYAHGRFDLNWAWRTVFLGFIMMSFSGSLMFNKVLWVIVGVGILLKTRCDILAEPESEEEADLASEEEQAAF